MRTSVSAMVIASSPGFSRFESTDRQLPSLSWIPATRERSGSHSSGHFELRDRVPALRPPQSRTPSRLCWRLIQGCAPDVQASSQWWFACFYYHMHAHAHHGARDFFPGRAEYAARGPGNASPLLGTVLGAGHARPAELRNKSNGRGASVEVRQAEPRQAPSCTTPESRNRFGARTEAAVPFVHRDRLFRLKWRR